MVKCEDCGKESYNENVCINCGLVINDHPLDLRTPQRLLNKKTSEKEFIYEISGPLLPDIQYLTKLHKGRKPFHDKGKKNKFIKGFKEITRICNTLQLGFLIKNEALNIFLNFNKAKSTTKRDDRIWATLLACVRIACKIHDYPISVEKFLEISKDSYFIKVNNNLVLNKKVVRKRFNKAFYEILSTFKLKIKRPEHPKFIDYTCNFLGVPQKFVTEIHDQFSKLKGYFKPHFKTEGYIIALVYLNGKKDYKFRMNKLGEIFHISPLTIGARTKEIKKILEVKKL